MLYLEVMKKQIRVKGKVALVFGVFDLIHKGHISFLKQAKKHGEKLVAIVARDSSVKKIKKRFPHESERQRLNNVRVVRGVSRAVLGDKVHGSYDVLTRLKPDVACLGYDQRELERDLRARIRKKELPNIKIVRLKAHKPKKFKTSIVAKNHFS